MYAGIQNNSQEHGTKYQIQSTSTPLIIKGKYCMQIGIIHFWKQNPKKLRFMPQGKMKMKTFKLKGSERTKYRQQTKLALRANMRGAIQQNNYINICKF